MNFKNCMLLNKHVQQNAQRIQLARKPMKDQAAEFERDLGFKVAVGPCRDALVEAGLATKMESKSTREIKARDSEIKRLRSILVQVVTASQVPDWLRAELLTEDINEEIKEAVGSRRTAKVG